MSRDYCVCWSAEDGEYVATCAAFPSLSWLDPDPVRALDGLVGIIVGEEPEPNENLRAAARQWRRFNAQRDAVRITSLMTGLSPERLAELGGVPDD